MILSASRRTDIPLFYSDWFFNRVREGYVLSRNPVNFRTLNCDIPDVFFHRFRDNLRVGKLFFRIGL
jgi:hypothetical protein